MTAAPPAPPLPADLVAGLRRLKLATMRTLAPELLLTARTQRWAPEDLLRTLVEAEIAARDASNAVARLKAAAFPVTKTLDQLDRSACSIPAATLDYLATLEWLRAKDNLALVGPPGTAKSHTLVALGHLAVDAGYRVRYFVAAELVDTLYRGLADNSVGRVIETILRADLVMIDELGFAPLDDTGAQLLFRLVSGSVRAPVVGHRQPLAVRTVGALPARAHHRRQPARPALAPRHRRGHRRRVVSDAPSQNPPARQTPNLISAPITATTHRPTSPSTSTKEAQTTTHKS